MKYYLEIVSYSEDGYFILKQISIKQISLDELLSLVDEDIICVEYYEKRMIGNDKAISSFIYKGSEKSENDSLFFITSQGDSFDINFLYVNIADLKTLVDGVRENDGIFNYLDRNVFNEVTVKYLVPCESGYDICEMKGTLYKNSWYGNITLDNKNIDFNSILSIKSSEVTYVNPFVGFSRINYYEYFIALENCAFGKKNSHGLRKKRIN